MRTALAILLLLGLAGLTGCPGSVIQPPAPGSGPGFYNGRFTDENDTTEYGAFTLRIEDTGEAHGSGQLNGRDVDLEGVLDGASGAFTGTVTDSLTALGGYFDGNISGGSLFGEFSFDQGLGAPDLLGLWDAVIKP